MGFIDGWNENVTVETQKDDIGPNFNKERFLKMLQRDAQAAYQRKCKKISGNDNAYTEAEEAKAQAKACLKAWATSEGISTNYQYAKLTRDFKPLIKKWVFIQYFE